MNYDNRIARLEATLLPPSEPLRILRVIIDENREAQAVWADWHLFDRVAGESREDLCARVRTVLGWQ